MPTTSFSEVFAEPGVRDTLNQSSLTLPGSGSTASTITTPNLKVRKPHVLRLRVSSAAALGAAYTFSVSVAFKNAAGTTLKTETTGNVVLASGAVADADVRVPVPSDVPIASIVTTATYVSGTSPGATVPLVSNTMPA